jgi:hypothetical protein
MPDFRTIDFTRLTVVKPPPYKGPNYNSSGGNNSSYGNNNTTFGSTSGSSSGSAYYSASGSNYGNVNTYGYRSSYVSGY